MEIVGDLMDSTMISYNESMYKMKPSMNTMLRIFFVVPQVKCKVDRDLFLLSPFLSE